VRIAVGQFGGPTPVLNASLHGALEAIAAADGEALGIRGGARGLEAGDFLPLPGPPPGWLLQAPGAALGAGRHRLDGDGLRRALARLRAAGADGVLLCGGNGTMGLAAALEAEAGGTPLVGGIPKTIDNDLRGTDHAPGYPSAATFVASAFHDLGTDLRGMAGFEDVRLVEVMGRDAGWLTAAAALGRAGPGDAPQIVLLPELPVDPEALAARVAEQHARDGSVLVAVAEGVRGPDGRPLGAGALDPAGARPVLGGAARHLADGLRRRLGLGVRAESLGFLPRCLRAAATGRDRSEEEGVGRAAAAAVLAGRGGVMVSIPPRPEGGPASDYGVVPLREVAGRERLLPPGMRSGGEAFASWLRPLLGSVPPPTRLF
jgi:6-phosphofructokinase 1